MEEHLLSTLLAGDELNIIDDQDIIISIPLVETKHLVVPNCIDDFVRKLFR